MQDVAAIQLATASGKQTRQTSDGLAVCAWKHGQGVRVCYARRKNRTNAQDWPRSAGWFHHVSAISHLLSRREDNVRMPLFRGLRVPVGGPFKSDSVEYCCIQNDAQLQHGPSSSDLCSSALDSM